MNIEEKEFHNFPSVKTGADIAENYLNLLEKDHKTDLKKMLFATSVCSDDVNVSTDFKRVLSRPSTMGGLVWLPYSGFTGMVAFSRHIPDGGDAYCFTGRISESLKKVNWEE